MRDKALSLRAPIHSDVQILAGSGVLAQALNIKQVAAVRVIDFKMVIGLANAAR